MTRTALSTLNPGLLAASMEPAAPSTPLRVLTTGLARGDDAAWAQFHREHGPTIFRHLLAATRGDHDLASEALQQTYLRVARHARPCESAAMFAAWLRTVARTALSDCRRRRGTFWQMLRRRAAETGSDAASPANDERLQRALDAALASLEREPRALLEAKYFASESVRALAERLNISEKALESRLVRARNELRHALAKQLSRDE